VFAGLPLVHHPLATLDAKRADRAVRSGKRLYEKATLLRYIEAESELIDRVMPDLVVGDFRLSLSTSAELCAVPSATLINAYWSPFAPRSGFPVPDHPVIRWLGERLTEEYFPRALPRVFRHFAEPLNGARKVHGLKPVGSLLEMLTHGTYTLYPDDPSLTPVRGAPAGHHFIGPVLWQPNLPPEPRTGSDGDPRPLVYVTLGSSGRVELLPLVIAALAQLPVRGLVATADRISVRDLPPNVVVRSYVRGGDVARRARLVISNGGSTTGYQALAEGTPVVGMPSNLDQFLASDAIARAGAGLTVKARHASVDSVVQAIRRGLDDEALRAGARRVASRFKALDSQTRFASWLGEVLPSRSGQEVARLHGNH
jgi:UDP:flavonoid glycosyltransferase YjiC (YdhE family)